MVDEILELFPDARIHSGYALIRCPYHADGNELKPSMSILLQPKQNLNAGFCHCFACGKITNIKNMFADLGYVYTPDLEKAPVQSPKTISLTNTPPVYKIAMPYRFSSYLQSRGIGKETQERFKIYEKDKKVYMPVYDRQGMYLYSNARSTEGKRFYVEEGAVKTLWGIEEIDLSKPITVCESQIDALSFWEVGVQAVATLGADNISSLKQIKQCTSMIVLAFDPDDAGRRATEKAANLLGKYRCRWLDLPTGIDINQALQDIKDHDKFKNFMHSRLREFRT